MTKLLLKSIAFTVVTVVATIALAGTIQNTTAVDGREYVALFTDATSLNVGDDVRMAGVKVGAVEDIGLVDNGTASVTFSVADSAPMTHGATAELRFRNLVGQRYIALHPAEEPGPPLPDGYTFGLDQTRPALDLTLLFNGFRPLFRFLSPEDVNTLSAQIIDVFQGEGATIEGLLSSTASLTSTLADRDQVIGELIGNLNSVLQVVNQRSGQLDTTLVTLQRLVSGLSEDRKAIGSTIEGMGDLTESVAGLLEEGRRPLRRSIDALGSLSANLADHERVVQQFLQRLPAKLDTIGTLASYGSWLNTYVCSISGNIPLPEGYMGDLGVRPVHGRCS